MSTTIAFTTGTGNSLWTARTLASLLPDAVAVPMRRAGPVEIHAERVGLVFPVHMWGVPAPVLDFIGRICLDPGAWLFAVAVNAGQVSRTLVQLEQVCARRELRLQSGISIELASNYLPWGGPGPASAIQARTDAARRKLTEYAPLVTEKRSAPVERGPLWQHLAFTPMYHLSFSKIATMDKSFWVDDRCNGCGTCVKVCPSGNIELEQGRPTWHQRCEQCLACIQWCPKESIQYGKKTPNYERYHHPEVKLAEMTRTIRESREE